MTNGTTLVLSDSLPHTEILHNASLPWFNGPFQDDDCVWSVRETPQGLELVRHKRSSEIVREGGKIKKDVKWIDVETKSSPL